MEQIDLEKFNDDDVLDAAIHDLVWNVLPRGVEVPTRNEMERVLDERRPELLRRRRSNQRWRIVRNAAIVAGLAAAIALGIYLLVSAGSALKKETLPPTSPAHSTSHSNPLPLPIPSTAPTAPTDQVAPPLAATPSADRSQTRPTSRALPYDKPASRFIDLSGNDFIDLTQAEAEKLGITFGTNGEIRFGYSYLFKSRPSIPDSLLEVLPFKDALTYGLRDSGLVTSLVGNTMRVTSRPTSEFRAGPIATSWRYLTDGRGAKITQRYDADTGNWRYAEGGVDYTWQQDKPVDERNYARREEALDRTYRNVTTVDIEVELHTWMPIRVPRPNAPPSATQHVVFWCAPTKELLAALPSQYLPRIRSELLVIANPTVEDVEVVSDFQDWAIGLISTLGAFGLETTVPIIDTRTVTLDTHLFGQRWQMPLPVEIGHRGGPIYSDSLRLQGLSYEPRKLTVRLLYFEGTPAATLLESHEMNVSRYYKPLHLYVPKRFAAGIYQLEFSTNKGQKATWRIFLDR